MNRTGFLAKALSVAGVVLGGAVAAKGMVPEPDPRRAIRVDLRGSKIVPHPGEVIRFPHNIGTEYIDGPDHIDPIGYGTAVADLQGKSEIEYIESVLARYGRRGI